MSCSPAAGPMAAFHGDLRQSSVYIRKKATVYGGERTLKLSAVLGESRYCWTHLGMGLWYRETMLVVVCDDMTR